LCTATADVLIECIETLNVGAIVTD